MKAYRCWVTSIPEVVVDVAASNASRAKLIVFRMASEVFPIQYTESRALRNPDEDEAAAKQKEGEIVCNTN